MKWNEAKIRYDKLGPKVVENLKKRHFDAYYVSTREEAIEKFKKSNSMKQLFLSNQKLCNMLMINNIYYKEAKQYA